MKKDDILELRMEDLAFGGSGVARHNGMVVFVPYTIPGETVRAKVTAVKKDYAEAMPEHIITPSPKRIPPACAYFATCQGCSYQHIDYASELEYKTKQVTDIFTRIGGFPEPPVKAAAGCPDEYYYRNKVRFRYRSTRDKKIFGYMLSDGRHTLDVEGCPIASRLINEKIREIRSGFALFESRGIRGYNLVIIEDGREAHTALEGNVILETEICGKKFRYSINSFFQVNRSVFESLKNYIVSITGGASAGKSLCDLYCGVGFFGILLSGHFEKIHFLEQNSVSVSFLNENIRLNGLSSAKVIAGDAGKQMSELDSRYDVVIIDPPRSGCDEAARASLAAMKPEKLIYISCNPATMARDIKNLCAAGFELVSLKPFDFFPRTKHIEIVAELSGK